MKEVLFIYYSYTVLLFIDWSYTIYKNRIIYLLRIHCIWRQYYLLTEATLYMKVYYLFTADTLYMKAVLFTYWSYTVYVGSFIYWLKVHCIRGLLEKYPTVFFYANTWWIII